MTFSLFIICLILALGVVFALTFYLSRGQSQKRKFAIWGVTAMFVIGPLLSYIVGIIYASISGEGFAGMALSGIVFPIIFLIGLTLLLIGLFILDKSVCREFISVSLNS